MVGLEIPLISLSVGPGAEVIEERDLRLVSSQIVRGGLFYLEESAGTVPAISSGSPVQLEFAPPFRRLAGDPSVQRTCNS